MDVTYFALATTSESFYVQVIDGSNQRLFVKYSARGEKINSWIWLDYSINVIDDIFELFNDCSAFEIEPCLWPYIVNKK